MAGHFHALIDSRPCPPHFVRGTPSEIVHDPAFVLRDFPSLAASRTLALGVQNRVALAILIAAVTAKEPAQATQHARAVPRLAIIPDCVSLIVEDQITTGNASLSPTCDDVREHIS